MAHHFKSSSAIPDSLKHFDSLPDSANVRQPVVQGLFGCSAATVWRMVKRGTLPEPRKLSVRVTAWNVGALRKALAVKADNHANHKKTGAVVIPQLIQSTNSLSRYIAK